MKPKKPSRHLATNPESELISLKLKCTVRAPSEIRAEREHEVKQLRSKFQKLIEKEPQEAARKAGVYLELATDALLGLTDSPDRYAAEDSENIRCNHFRRLAGELEQMMQRGNHYPLATAWFIGSQLAQAIHDLVLEEPRNKRAIDHLFTIASKSFFLPSLRSRNSKFTFDFEKVANAVQLSDFCMVKLDEESLARLDTPVTMFTAETIEAIGRTRDQVKRVHSQIVMKRFMLLHRRNKLKSGQTSDEIEVSDAAIKRVLRLGHKARDIPMMLDCFKLPDLHATTVNKWRRVIFSIIDNPETLTRLQGTRLYRSLAAGNDNKEYKMRDELKLRVKQVMQSTLIRAPDDSPVSRIRRRVMAKQSPATPIKPGGI
jgi:hypothetical protein